MDTVTIYRTPAYKFAWYRCNGDDGVFAGISEEFPDADTAYNNAREHNPDCAYVFSARTLKVHDDDTAEQLDEAEVELIRAVLRLVRREYGQKPTVHDREELLRVARRFVELAAA